MTVPRWDENPAAYDNDYKSCNTGSAVVFNGVPYGRGFTLTTQSEN